MRILIKDAKIVNEGKSFQGSVVIEDEEILEVIKGEKVEGDFDKTLDASGCFLLPGIIDEHVHFREPGLTNKADIESESRAAAYGGVTSFFDMPNTVPQTTTLEALEDKFKSAREKSHVNYSFFFGATNSNLELIKTIDVNRVPGIKIFMGSSFGNMLVDKKEALEKIFSSSKLPIMVHCEDTDIINLNMKEAQEKYGEDPDIIYHPKIRSQEACYKSTFLAIELAKKYNTPLHIAHVSTSKELSLIKEAKETFKNITAEAVIAHLYFSLEDYPRLGALIKCNPAIKTLEDRQELRSSLTDGRISAIATDHAPHEIKEKQGGSLRAASGMPMIQFSLVTMLELVDKGVLSIERLVELMCHNPARIFSVGKRGFIRKGYKADLVTVKPGKPWTLTEELIQSKCKWSPLLGHTFTWEVSHTLCNGHIIFDKGRFDETSRGEEIKFER
ncbi:MAG: dihydroorotase [Prevotella sp.]|nr:dihydroorotase [Prevotella sp.]